MEWSWTGVLYHPGWVVSTVILGLVVRMQRKGSWNPRACPVDLTGKTAIVTGANTGYKSEQVHGTLITVRDDHLDVSDDETRTSYSGKSRTGIGKFIALDLAHRKARVILACRSQERGQAALEEIRRKSHNSNVHLQLVDTSSLRSVRDFAHRINQEEKRLDILVNNAGASGLPKAMTSEGLELSFATNHLGPFLLTNLLLDLMKRSTPARIVNVSSANHWRGVVDFSHFHGENLTYRLDSVYNHTKLHNILCTNELARRLQGTGVTANSLHPGMVMTEVMRYYNWLIRALFNIVGFFFMKSSMEGAVSSIYCAVSEDVEGITGKYFDSDCSLVLPSPLARDTALARKDWEVCERLTGLSGGKDQ